MERLFQSVAHRFSKLNSEERWQVSALGCQLHLLFTTYFFASLNHFY